MINILIIENNIPTRKLIANLLGDIHSNHKCYMADSLNSTLSLLESHRFDLVIINLDLDEPLNGIGVGQSIQDKVHSVKIIAISASPDLALQALQIHAYDFVLKPINLLHFKQKLEHALLEIDKRKIGRNNLQKHDRLLVKTKKEIHWIPFKKIIFIEKLHKDVYIHTEDDAISVRQNICDIHALLPEGFLRVHKSYIVNADHITKIVEHGDRSYEIYFLSCEKTAYMSRYQAPVLLDKLDQA
ncbi:LytR/AlgR family response regulator transcription factor [Fusibacter sp. JL216-2]|uniref:LytR/AlgR family response regulator transcription factor n=1 Tax=Fusibacter sp. JL216-2 TaxID=3071453 RepID=UPI003D3542F5